MQFYHGSKENNITELTTNHSRDGYVYATSSRLVALTYMARSQPNLFSSQYGQECFFELKPNLFKEMVSNKSGYIYVLESKDFVPAPHSINCGHKNCYRINENVQVVSKEYIEDAYTELLKYVESGELKILTENELLPKEKEQMIKQIKDIAKTLNEKEINAPDNFWKRF